MQYKHVLLATDLSTANKYAAQEASRLAKQNNAKLAVVHVTEVPNIYSIGYMKYEDIEKKLTEEATPKLNEYLKSMDITPDKTIILTGSPKEQILAAAQQADLLVIGSHGQYGITEAIGSTVNAVLQRIKCNVLIVRSES